MHWNHRIIDFTTENKGEPLFGFAEVYYDDQGKPSSYCSPFMECESLDALDELVLRLVKARSEPVIKVEDFPEPSDDTNIHTEVLT